MAHYGLAELDLSTRITLAQEMLQPLPEREWGRVTELAQTYGVSRAFLYQLRDRALHALTSGLGPRQPDPQPLEETLLIDRDFIRRAIVVLPLLKGTVRDIQPGLHLLLGVQRSTGYISQTLTAAGEKGPLTKPWKRRNGPGGPICKPGGSFRAGADRSRSRSPYPRLNWKQPRPLTALTSGAGS
jgi:hypothetical protein